MKLEAGKKTEIIYNEEFSEFLAFEVEKALNKYHVKTLIPSMDKIIEEKIEGAIYNSQRIDRQDEWMLWVPITKKYKVSIVIMFGMAASLLFFLYFFGAIERLNLAKTVKGYDIQTKEVIK